MHSNSIEIKPRGSAVHRIPARKMYTYLQTQVRVLGFDTGTNRLNSLCTTLFGDESADIRGIGDDGRSASKDVGDVPPSGLDGTLPSTESKGKTRKRMSVRNLNRLRRAQLYQLPSLHWQVILDPIESELKVFQAAGEFELQQDCMCKYNFGALP